MTGDFYQYFRFCPLCYDESSVEAQSLAGRLFGGMTYASCTSCSARWEISVVGLDRKLTAAKLISDGVDRRGGHLLGRAYHPLDWQQLALKGRRGVVSKGVREQVVVKEVVREVVLIACRHCGARSPQGTAKCSTCGSNL